MSGYRTYDSALWDSVYASGSWGRYPAEDLVRFAATNLYPLRGGRRPKVLELGCGPGGNLWFFVREGMETHGVDGSSKAIELAKQQLQDEFGESDGSMSLWVGDLTSLPCEDGTYDAVVDNEAVYLNSFPRSVQIYDEAARVLRPGGWLFVRTFASGTWGEDGGTRDGNGMVTCRTGPLAGKGKSRFTARFELDELLRSFSLRHVELTSRFLESTEATISEWIVWAQK